ncbi:hypothetical protein V6N13_059354 [Hibiscus sabdariffa]|uniref:Uncharacterized protein n=1 Tax=Hibiscus sabdariffa TaxID=183260 RepID=A0ABR2GDQ3_9ROSI
MNISLCRFSPTVVLHYYLLLPCFNFPFSFAYVLLHQSEYECSGGEEIRGVESETCGRVREFVNNVIVPFMVMVGTREALMDFGNEADARAKKY